MPKQGRQGGRKNDGPVRGTLNQASVSVVAELERLQVPFKFAGPSEVVAICPFHDDDSPSCCVNVEKRVFECKACKAHGDFVSWMARHLRVSRTAVTRDLIERYGSAGDKAVNAETVERYHAALDEAGPLLEELRKRGVSEQAMRRYRLGFDRATSRITIPIPDEAGVWVNVRKYLPGAPGREKMRNMRTRGHIRLFPPEQLRYEKLVLVGGEIKAIVTAEHMNRMGIGAVCMTGGEGNWTAQLLQRLRDKEVWVCMDVDAAGESAAAALCSVVHRLASSVRKVSLPLDVDKYPHGDVNDYFGPAEGKTAKDFRRLLDSSPRWEPPRRDSDESSPPERMQLAEAMQASNVGRRVEVKAIVRALDTTPYLVPAKVRCSCSRDEDDCQHCPVYAMEQDANGFTPLRISAESPAVLGMMGQAKVSQTDSIREALSIPGSCRSSEFLIDEHYAVEDARLAPHLDIGSRAVEREMVPAAIVGHQLETNSGYVMRGRVHPHPRTQQAYLLVSQFEPAEDALSTYVPTEEDLASLEFFRPRSWTAAAVDERLSALYADLSCNVTRIYEREDMHRTMDLVIHSPLTLEFDGLQVKGWAEGLVIGDSAQGKSETAAALMRHYGVGEKVDCKNATVAGLLGGLVSSAGRYFVTWGTIPSHDARLVVLEELKGADPQVIGKLTDMRSSGIAEIPKIEKRRTRARTRLLALSNPRSGHPLSSYNYGVEAVSELMGSAEDVRRFDVVCVAAAGQVDSERINGMQRARPTVDHTHTSELCRRLVLWAWTRSAVFLDTARDAVLAEASRLCKLYADDVPIVDRGSARHKLARLSAACAARTFSTDDAGRVLVRPCHVEAVVALLERMYADPAFGYLEYSRSVAELSSMKRVPEVRRALFQTPYPQDLVNQLLANEAVEMRDICDWCAFDDRGDAMALLSLLTRAGALRRPVKERHYRKTPDFIRLLREMRDSEEMKKAGRPAFTEGDSRGIRKTVVDPDDV